MKAVIDTNVLLVSVSSRSSLHWIFRALLDGDFTLCVTTDILSEYAEILERHMGVEVSKSVMSVLEHLPNLRKVDYYYRFQLLPDPDDNKFVDCAVASNAHVIVSYDKDFNALDRIAFPRVTVMDAEKFREYLFHQ